MLANKHKNEPYIRLLKKKMRLLKSHPLLKLFNSYLIDHSQPSNISYLWNFGSLLAICLGIQIVTGVTLAMHYNPNVLEAFNSIEHIMRDVNNGWLIRYLHSNTASAFFFLVYLHIGRGLYYGSYRAPRTLTWIIGTIILILMIAIGFLGLFCYLHKFKNKNLTMFAMAQNDFYKIKCNKNFTSLITNNLIKMNFKYPVNFKTCSLNNRFYSVTRKSSRIDMFLKTKNLESNFIYDNLQDHNVRKQILQEPEIQNGGIYLILNKETLAFYIGSALPFKFHYKFVNHLIEFKGNKTLKKAVKKYKLYNFCFIILKTLRDDQIYDDNTFSKINDEEINRILIYLEDFYIKSLLPDYNILTEARSRFRYKHFEIPRLDMKSRYSEKYWKQIFELNKDKFMSLEEMREEIRSKKNVLNLEDDVNILIVVWDLFTGLIHGRYKGLSETALALNCSTQTIRRCLMTHKKLVKRRYKLRYF